MRSLFLWVLCSFLIDFCDDSESTGLTRTCINHTEEYQEARSQLPVFQIARIPMNYEMFVLYSTSKYYTYFHLSLVNTRMF